MHNNSTDRDFDLVFGETTIKGRVPLHMMDRFRICDSLTDVGESEALARLCAVIGLCWAGDDLGVPSLRSLGYDLTEYGEHVYDVLYRLEMVGDLVPPGLAAHRAVVDSIPTKDEVDEAADFTEPPPAENSIAIT